MAFQIDVSEATILGALCRADVGPAIMLPCEARELFPYSCPIGQESWGVCALMGAHEMSSS